MTDPGSTEREAAEGGPGVTGAPPVAVPAARAIAASNWMVLVYVILIALCVIFAPDRPLKFIYTEF